jgi:Fe-S cluster biogenesis protein NfuA
MASGSTLGTSLLRIEGVQSILFGSDFVSVTKVSHATWAHVKPSVFALLTTHFSSETPTPIVGDEAAAAAMAPPKDTEILPEDSEVVAMIKELLDTRIRPTIQDDGGDLEYMGFNSETGIVHLKLKGACRTCDSSVVTLKNGIENMLKYFIPEVTSVEQILDVADHEFAKFESTLKENEQIQGKSS